MPPKQPAPRPAAKKRPARRRAPAQRARTVKPRAAPPKPAGPPPGDEVGRVVAFFRLPVVAVVRVTRGPLVTGQPIWIKGHTTDLKMRIASMQMDHQPIAEARKGAEVGLQVPSRARRGDRVYRLSD